MQLVERAGMSLLRVVVVIKNLTETVKETAAAKAKGVPRNVTIKLPDIRGGAE